MRRDAATYYAPVDVRLWRRVDKTEDCWIWTGSRVPSGYGQMTVNRRRSGTHRIAWELTNGPIPPGLHVLHSCDNPPCVNPAHLFLGTAADNAADKVAKGRAKAGPYTERSRAARERLNAFLRGSRVGTSRLTEAAVAEILVRTNRGEQSAVVAQDYGVSRSTVDLIVKGKTWRHVTAMAGALDPDAA